MARLSRTYAGLLRGAAGRVDWLSRLLLRPTVSDPPNRAAGIVRDQQRAILRDGQRSRATPDLGAVLTGNPEAGHEVLVVALWLAILEGHTYDLVARRLRTVPRADRKSVV